MLTFIKFAVREGEQSRKEPQFFFFFSKVCNVFLRMGRLPFYLPSCHFKTVLLSFVEHKKKDMFEKHLRKWIVIVWTV